MRWVFLTLFVIFTGCSNRTAAPVVPEALSIGTNKTVFVGTTRIKNAEGVYGIGRSTALTLLKLQVSIPPNRKTGTISYGFEKPKPERDFVIADQRRFSDTLSFRSALKADIQSKENKTGEVVVFVHGFNNSFSDTAFRIAQLAQDLELPGSLVTYSWPSRGHPLGYEYDSDSSLFARDGLQELMENVKASGAKRLVMVAHSMGGRVLMETLRQIELRTPGWTARNLSGVVLISPDVNADVFLSQVNAFQALPQPFVVFTSQRDVLLRLSSGLRWEDQRLGTIDDITPFSGYPIDFVDVTAFEDRSSGNHFTAGNLPALIALLKSPEQLDRGFLQGTSGAVGTLPGSRRVLRNATQIIVAKGGRR